MTARAWARPSQHLGEGLPRGHGASEQTGRHGIRSRPMRGALSPGRTRLETPRLRRRTDRGRRGKAGRRWLVSDGDDRPRAPQAARLGARSGRQRTRSNSGPRLRRQPAFRAQMVGARPGAAAGLPLGTGSHHNGHPGIAGTIEWTCRSCGPFWAGMLRSNTRRAPLLRDGPGAWDHPGSRPRDNREPPDGAGAPLDATGADRATRGPPSWESSTYERRGEGAAKSGPIEATADG